MTITGVIADDYEHAEYVNGLLQIHFRHHPANAGNYRAEILTSRYDDINNGIDNVIVGRTTGNIVGALDEVGETNGPAVQEKKRDIANRNQHGGAAVRVPDFAARRD